MASFLCKTKKCCSHFPAFSINNHLKPNAMQICNVIYRHCDTLCISFKILGHIVLLFLSLWQKHVEFPFVELLLPWGCSWSESDIKQRRILLDGQTSQQYILHVSLCRMQRKKKKQYCVKALRCVCLKYLGEKTNPLWAPLLFAASLKPQCWAGLKARGLNNGTVGLAAATVNLLGVQLLVSQHQNRCIRKRGFRTRQKYLWPVLPSSPTCASVQMERDFKKMVSSWKQPKPHLFSLKLLIMNVILFPYKAFNL